MPAEKIALYSAIIGHYERPSEILPTTIAEGMSSGVDLFRFTDSPDSDSNSANLVGATRWQELQVSPQLPMDPIRSARAIKILGHPVLSQYDVTIWVDNRIQLKIGPEELVERFLPSHSDLAVPLHSFHGSLAVEFDEILDRWVDDPRRVREQRSAYSKTVPALLAEPVSWTAILIRRNNAAIRAFNALWWEQVLRYSRRDQLSFPYVCEKTPEVNVEHFAIDNFESDLHEWLPSSAVSRHPRARLWNPRDMSLVDLASEFRDARRMLTARIKKGLSGRN